MTEMTKDQKKLMFIQGSIKDFKQLLDSLMPPKLKYIHLNLCEDCQDFILKESGLVNYYNGGSIYSLSSFKICTTPQEICFSCKALEGYVYE